MAPRKRSAVWTFCRRLNDKRVQCMLCRASFTQNSRNMLKHLRAKHPAEFANAEESNVTGRGSETTNTDQQMTANVEVELEEDDHVTTVNEADITCAIDGLFAAEGQVVEGQREKGEAGGDGPSSTRKWSSIWMHYECLENQKCAMCLLCMEKLYHHSSTSNLHRHLSKRHPEVVARLGGIIKKRPSKAVKHTPSKAGSSKPSKKILVKEKFSDVFEGIRACEGEVRVLERERELTEALRNAQKQEARALEQQKELLDMMQRANAREMAAERESVECLRRTQEQESRDLARQREELQREREKLQMEREQLQREREELQYLRNSQPAD